MSRQLRDESIHWLSDLILDFMRENEFAKGQDADVGASALAMALFRYLYFRCEEEDRRVNFTNISNWMLSSLDTYKPDWKKDAPQ